MATNSHKSSDMISVLNRYLKKADDTIDMNIDAMFFNASYDPNFLPEKYLMYLIALRTRSPVHDPAQEPGAMCDTLSAGPSGSCTGGG